MSSDPQALAREFWSGTGLAEACPRPIERVIGMKLPLSVLKLSAISAAAVGAWLKRHGLPAPLPADDRELAGCLIAYRGHGIIFACLADPSEEQRLTIAHEVAHFIADYLAPRQRVIRALGEEIAEVLDGRRPPSVAERAQAVLSHVRLGAHMHLLPRRGRDEDSDVEVADAEHRADALAMELVAPRQEVDRCLAEGRSPGEMAAHFGLPTYVFEAIRQRQSRPHPRSLIEEARASLRNRS